MKAYCVQYKLYESSEVKSISFLASSKVDAYDKGVYEVIPKSEGTYPYSARVYSVTHNNGNEQTFNTFEGKPI